MVFLLTFHVFLCAARSSRLNLNLIFRILDGGLIYRSLMEIVKSTSPPISEKSNGCLDLKIAHSHEISLEKKSDRAEIGSNFS